MRAFSFYLVFLSLLRAHTILKCVDLALLFDFLRYQVKPKLRLNRIKVKESKHKLTLCLIFFAIHL